MPKSMEVFCQFHRFVLLSGMPVPVILSLNHFLLGHLPDKPFWLVMNLWTPVASEY
jgi:hypothetical protein